MMLNPAIAAAERTETARHLIAQAQVDVTADLVKRGLLIDGAPQHRTVQAVTSYSFKPELGLMLAARCRPAFVVLAKGERDDLRPLSLFALGDQADPVRAIVAEVPTGLPPDRAVGYPDTRKLGPLGWIYRYVLVSSVNAADLLARWTMTRLRRQAMRCPCGIWCPPTARTVSTRSATISGFGETGPGRSWTGPASAARSRPNMTLKGSEESCLTCLPGHRRE